MAEVFVGGAVGAVAVFQLADQLKALGFVSSVAVSPEHAGGAVEGGAGAGVVVELRVDAADALFGVGGAAFRRRSR